MSSLQTQAERSTQPAFTLAEVARACGGELRGVDQGVRGVSTDSRHLEEGQLFVALEGETFDGHDFLEAAFAKGAAAALVRRGHPVPRGAGPCVEVDDTLRALGALARFHRRRFTLPVGAITGSNGKTTTKELAAAAFARAFGAVLHTEGNFNNEIGLPHTLFRLRSDHEAAVLEMGMNHPGEIARLTAIAEPRAGLVTCAHPVHLEGLGSVEAVARAKGELFHGLPADGVAVANREDPLVYAEARRSGRPLLTFGGPGADVALLGVRAHDAQGLRFELSIQGAAPVEVRLPLVGLHNAENACAALALGIALGGRPDALIEGLQRARPFARRLERKAIPGTRVTVLDDCYNGNPSSTLAALRTVRALAGEGRVLAVLGDLRELGGQEVTGHEEVGRAAAEAGVAGLVAFGALSRTTARAAHAAGLPAEDILHTEAPEEALAWLRERMRDGDWILFKASRGMRLERIVDPLVGAGEGN